MKNNRNIIVPVVPACTGFRNVTERVQHPPTPPVSILPAPICARAPIAPLRCLPPPLCLLFSRYPLPGFPEFTYDWQTKCTRSLRATDATSPGNRNTCSPRFDMPTDTQDHCSNLHGIWLDTRDAMRGLRCWHLFPGDTYIEPGGPVPGEGNESQRSEQELSVKLVKFNFDFSNPESPWDVTVPAMTNGVRFEHKSRTPRLASARN